MKATGYYVTFGKPLVNNDEIMWSTVEITGPDPYMEVHGHVPFDVAFGQDLINGQGLTDLLNHIELLVTMFGTQFFQDA